MEGEVGMTGSKIAEVVFGWEGKGGKGREREGRERVKI